MSPKREFHPVLGTLLRSIWQDADVAGMDKHQGIIASGKLLCGYGTFTVVKKTIVKRVDKRFECHAAGKYVSDDFHAEEIDVFGMGLVRTRLHLGESDHREQRYSLRRLIRYFTKFGV